MHPKLSTALEVVGLVSITVAGFLVSAALGFGVAGLALVALGVAGERG